MNAIHAPRPDAPQHADIATRLPTARVVRIARPARRERDFGIGYGNSSGYASDRRYVRDWGTARFRVA